ncbi:hypothetical protein [Desertibacillus haloalkaliphilus]|uniref:hypothetical protein n=1 Tax=Desertibacillus haloalkaliphilus TaxID=1328930 RepID=UPI001C26FE13|nr:hypothetical protein [Desertibacillus haloalkaliphilus]MBU8908313.1 hypothetical protein [Desertibacillus haloalkaliphilus]
MKGDDFISSFDQRQYDELHALLNQEETNLTTSGKQRLEELKQQLNQDSIDA